MRYYLDWKEEEMFFRYARGLCAAEMPVNTNGFCAEEKVDIQIESPKVPLWILAEND
jgi:hypothetical protein